MNSKYMNFSAIAFLAAIIGSTAWAANPTVAPAPNGITLPEGYKDWRVISVSYRTDKNSIRAIVGNDKAIEAARKGQTNP